MDLHQHQQRQQQQPQYHNFDQIQLVKFQLNKLQAYKSSFQAWKCVSFGYALLAIVLLFSKWHEVTTDLKLLTGIDQLIWSNGSLHHDQQLLVSSSGATDSNRTDLSPLHQMGATSAINSNRSTSAILGQALTRSWPPLALETLLLNVATSASNSSNLNGSGALVDSSDDAPATSLPQDNSTSITSSESISGGSPSSMLMSHHMKFVAGRELSGSQLLRQEVESFLGQYEFCPEHWPSLT